MRGTKRLTCENYHGIRNVQVWFVLITLFFWFGTVSWLECREHGLKYTRNFKRHDYVLHPQNWSIVQDKRGMIYVANQGGLLEFDGVSWRIIPVPNQSVRSLHAGADGRIYIGGNNEFGYLDAGADGRLRYRSLLEFLDKKDRDFSTIWNIQETQKGIYFFSVKKLYRLDVRVGKIKVWSCGKYRFMGMFACNGELYLRRDKLGLVRLINDSFEPVPGGAFFADKKIYMLVPFDAGTEKILIGTQRKGIFIYNGGGVTPFETGVADYLKENLLYRGIRLSSGDFAIATLYGGLVVVEPGGGLKRIFNETTGLQDDNVKFVFEDNHRNLWLGLESGISMIEYNSALSYYSKSSGLSGIVLCSARHGGDLYAGTKKGVFRLSSSGRFENVGIRANCWDLLSFDDVLLAATTGGVFELKENRVKRIFNKHAYVLRRSELNPDYVRIGTRDDGLCSLTRDETGGQWNEGTVIGKISGNIRSIAEDNKGHLWLGTPARGVLRIIFPGGDRLVPQVRSYYHEHGLPKGEILVSTIGGNVVFCTQRGVYVFDESTGRFSPDSRFDPEFSGGTRNIFRFVEDKNGQIWFHSNGRNLRALPSTGGRYLIDPSYLRRIPAGQVNHIFAENNAVWFSHYDGLVRFDTRFDGDGYEFPAAIRKIDLNGRSIYNGNKIKEEGTKPGSIPVFHHRVKDLSFHCAAQFYEGGSGTRYSYFLEGYDEDWTGWTSESRRHFTNLDAGDYVFRVKARNVFNKLSNEDVFRFKVLPPWYAAWWAVALYVAVMGLTMFLVVKWRSGRLEREKRKLEFIVKNRTREINEQKQQLEKQTVLLKEQSGKLEEMDRVKSRFFANISHEFRTPLTLIMGPLEQMLTDGGEGEDREKLNMMLRNTQRLLRLINQLLDLSRLDSGKLKLRASFQDILLFLEGLVSTFEPLARQKEINLSCSYEEKSISLYFDPVKLEEIILNLLSNAFKFTPPGGGISVSLKRGEADEKNFPHGYVQISISDTGMGISREKLPFIFDRFYQARESRSWEHTHKGTGIGLALTRELVTLHRGRIDVHSIEGKGTEFVIRLPMGDKHLGKDEKMETVKSDSGYDSGYDSGHIGIEDAVREVEVSEPGFAGFKDLQDESGKNGENGKNEKPIVLVVEDNAEVRQYIRGPLEPEYTVSEAVDGREGIDKAREIVPDLIISDIMMPEIDGYELCRVLKKDVNTSHIPVILLTARASEESVVEGFETGADDYVTKPFNTRVLVARVKNLIQLRRQMQLKIQRQKMLLPAEIPVSSIDEKFLAEFQEIIEKNLSDPDFNIRHLCEKLYMGRSTLFRKVQALTGETPNQFVQSYRLERAAQLLKSNFGSITEIAFEVGFSSAAYFTKCFKEKFHCLPSSFQSSEIGSNPS